MSAGWPPARPVPSLAEMPVDASMTEPTQAYYKLLFGDEATGFSYYVQSAVIVIGRNPVSSYVFRCDRLMVQRTSPCPDSQLLAGGDNSLVNEGQAPVLPLSKADVFQDRDRFPEDAESSISPRQRGSPSPSHLDSPRPEEASLRSKDEGRDTAETAGPKEETDSGDHLSAKQARPETDPHLPVRLDPPKDSDQSKVQTVLPLVNADSRGVTESHFAGSCQDGGVQHDPEEPPPPPPESSSAHLHVDVDLGPLKSVSRNHAVIQFSPDLPGWTLRIVGRNGAWINERFCAKGLDVPLQHR